MHTMVQSVSSNTRHSNMPRTAIGPEDFVSVRGRYLYKADGKRFFMKGIAFPVPEDEKEYNATAWIGILHQLKSLDLDYNTVRIYRMRPEIDYSEFFDAAASLGVYVVVPLTGAQGSGVLDRGKRAPKCYPHRLFRYGVACLHNYLQYPNALGGLLGNEVMNSLETWSAAPCIKAYGRDLKIYMDRNFNRSLPLIYAAQNTGLGASLDEVETMRLTSDYLTCESSQVQISTAASLSHSPVEISTAASLSQATMSNSVGSAIDIFGINVESWCSSKGTFESNEDGSVGSYYKLWQGLKNSSIPLIFTEMGCSHLHFDHDNGLATEGGDRDWKQVSAVLHDMADTFSGFCAYAYDGNPQFDMFRGGPWRGDPLTPTDDFFNFRDQLKKDAGSSLKIAPSQQNDAPKMSICSHVDAELRSCCDIKMHDIAQMKQYSTRDIWLRMHMLYFVLGAVLLMAVLFINHKRKSKPPSQTLKGDHVEVTYQSINV